MLFKIALKDRKNLPGEPGIYIVRDEKGTCLYVGKSGNLRERWRGTDHHRYFQAVQHNAYLQYFLCNKEDLDDYEIQMIEVLKPLWNYTTPGKPCETYPLGMKHWEVYQCRLNQPMQAIATNLSAGEAIYVLPRNLAPDPYPIIQRKLEEQGYYVVKTRFSTYLIKHRSCCLREGASVAKVEFEFA
jgi:hypothetical protein